MWTLATLLLSTLPAKVTASVPGQPVEVSLEIPDYLAQEDKAQRALLFGTCGEDSWISLLCEENAPYLSGEECAAAKKGVKQFSVGKIPCTETEMELGKGFLAKNDFHAFVATPDYLFTIHGSSLDKEDPKMTRKQFSAIVASFAVEGAPDRSKLSRPAAYYELRDEAAKQGKDQLAWIKSRCKEQPADVIARSYLVDLLELRGDSGAASGAADLAELLEAKAGRSEWETTRLIRALDAVAAAHGAKKEYGKAIPVCTRIVALTEGEEAGKHAAFLASAQYHLAVCHAQKLRKKPALEWLAKAVASDPKLKGRARSDPLLEPLHAPQFWELLR